MRHYAKRNTLSGMIHTFKCRDTQALFVGESPKRFRVIQTAAERKLAQLDAAHTLEFLRSPPGNRFEALKGNHKNQYSLRINDQWRICFEWRDGGVWNVEIIDYH